MLNRNNNLTDPEKKLPTTRGLRHWDRDGNTIYFVYL